LRKTPSNELRLITIHATIAIALVLKHPLAAHWFLPMGSFAKSQV